MIPNGGNQLAFSVRPSASPSVFLFVRPPRGLNNLTQVEKQHLYDQYTLWFSTTIGDNAKVYRFSPVLGKVSKIKRKKLAEFSNKGLTPPCP